MNKLSSTKVAEVLSQIGPALQASQEKIASQNETIAELKEKIAQYERRDRVTKIANQMQAKNLNPDSTLDEKIESLMGADDLDVVEKAIDYSAPQIKVASLSDHSGNASDAESSFVAGLME